MNVRQITNQKQHEEITKMIVTMGMRLSIVSRRRLVMNSGRIFLPDLMLLCRERPISTLALDEKTARDFTVNVTRPQSTRSTLTKYSQLSRIGRELARMSADKVDGNPDAITSPSLPANVPGRIERVRKMIATSSKSRPPKKSAETK